MMSNFSYQVIKDKRFNGDEQIKIYNTSTNCFTGYYFQKDSEGWYSFKADNGWSICGLSSHNMIGLADYMQKLNEGKQCN